MKAEIGVNCDGLLYLYVEAESETEWSMLKHAAPLLGMELRPEYAERAVWLAQNPEDK